MPVSFSYSGERVFTKKSSKPLMNELSWTTVIDLTAALARRGAIAAAAPPTRVVVRNSRRVLMRPPPRVADGMRGGSLLARQDGVNARGLQRTDKTDRDQALAASVPPESTSRSGVCGTLGPVARPVKASAPDLDPPGPRGLPSGRPRGLGPPGVWPLDRCPDGGFPDARSAPACPADRSRRGR